MIIIKTRVILPVLVPSGPLLLKTMIFCPFSLFVSNCSTIAAKTA